MCNTCWNTCNPCNACGDGFFNNLFGCSCRRCSCCQCHSCGGGCGGGTGTAGNGCGCGANNGSTGGCGCNRRVSVPITGRIYFDMPSFRTQTTQIIQPVVESGAVAVGNGIGSGCAGTGAAGVGYDAYYARQYGMYPYNNGGNGCGCGN